jgi:hypothetical protein
MGLFGFMTYELARGHDPALGHKATVATPPAPKRVLIKRVEYRIIVTKLLPAKDDEDAPVRVRVPAVTSTTVVAPVPSAAGQPAVAQPAPAAAPAPQPAPVVTRSS